MNIKEQIQDLLKDEDVVAELNRAIDAKYAKIVPLVEKRCKEVQQQLIWVKIRPSLHPARHPIIWVSGYQSEGSYSFIQIDGEWCWYDGTPSTGKVYAHKIVRGLEPLFDGAEVLAACTALGEELGMEVAVEEFYVMGMMHMRNACTPDDLLVLHPSGEILGQGELWKSGWDIPDHWAIVKDAQDRLHVYHSTNGHGMGYDFHAESRDDLDDFLNRMLDPGFEGEEKAWAILKDAGWVK